MAGASTQDFDPIFLKVFQIQPSKGDRKRLDILRATLECIEADGVEGLTFDSIAKRIRTRASHVAYYYPDKTDLLEAAYKYALALGAEIVRAEVSRAETPREKLRAMAFGNFKWAARHPAHLALFLHYQYSSAVSERSRVVFAQARELGRARIEEILREAPFTRRMTVDELWEASKAIHWILTCGLWDQVSLGSPRGRSFRDLTADTAARLYDTFAAQKER